MLINRYLTLFTILLLVSAKAFSQNETSIMLPTKATAPTPDLVATIAKEPHTPIGINLLLPKVGC